VAARCNGGGPSYAVPGTKYYHFPNRLAVVAVAVGHIKETMESLPHDTADQEVDLRIRVLAGWPTLSQLIDYSQQDSWTQAYAASQPYKPAINNIQCACSPDAHSPTSAHSISRLSNDRGSDIS